METNMDFIQWLGPDLSIKVFSCLDDPGDLVRASAVCSSWEHFVIVNGLCKQLCLKMIPEIFGVVPRIEKFIIQTDRNKCKRYYTYTEWGCLKRNHKLYAHLAFGFTPRKNNCILYGMDVSLFDSNYEALAYRLCSNLCLVTEINVQPFLAYYDNGLHMYSPKAVRFRLGYRRRGKELESMIDFDKTLNFRKKFCWTYTSPKFPMSQENKLQTFKLPKPVLCIGGVLLVELFVRGQKQKVDNYFHSWITWYDECESHVEVVARTVISPELIVRIHPCGRYSLLYSPHEHDERECKCLFLGEPGYSYN
ncbi:F-box protein [Trifolium repens]|nr:F-box protein [Trifolium repens]